MVIISYHNSSINYFMHSTCWHSLLSFQLIPWYSQSIKTTTLWSSHFSPILGLHQTPPIHTLRFFNQDSILWSAITIPALHPQPLPFPLTHFDSFIWWGKIYPSLNQAFRQFTKGIKQLNMAGNKYTSLLLFSFEIQNQKFRLCLKIYKDIIYCISGPFALLPS